MYKTKKFANYFHDKVRNLPLSFKFFCIIFFNFATFLVIFVLCFTICTRAYNRLLYEAIAGNLSFSSQTISSALENIEDLSSMIVSNETVQDSLSIIDESSSIVDRFYADSALNSALFSYFDTLDNLNISFLALSSDYSVNCTNWLQYRQSDPAFIDQLYQTADLNEGQIQWVWQPKNPNGLFLVRSIRKIKNLSLTPMGNLILNVDMSELIQSANSAATQYGDSYYLIVDSSGTVLYKPENLDEAMLPPIDILRSKHYGPVSYQGHTYFSVYGTIPHYNWNYINLIPFDSVSSSLRFSYMLAFFIVLIGSLILAALSTYFIRSIMVHFDSLIYKMDAFSKNELAIPVSNYDYQTRKDEIGKVHQQFDLMMNRIRTLVNKNYVNEILKQDAQLKALEAQINPHFLYNTLESINWRAKSSGNEQISMMTEALGTLLRATLSNKQSLVPLSYELELVSCYITIQKLRFEEELEFQLSVVPNAKDAIVPPLTIQPLVENAIHYGMENMDDLCHVFVTITTEDDELLIFIKNDGSTMEDNLLQKLENQSIKPNGFGLGILNINKRIQLLFGEKYGLSFFNEDGFATAQITLPYKTEV